MPNTHLDRYIAAGLLKADLSAIDAHFSKVGITDMAGIVHLKSALLALANIVEFEQTVRGLYREHRTLSEVFSENRRKYDFAKYMRNKFVGHIHLGLIEKAIEWKPELRYLVAWMDDQKVMFVVNIFVLEAAINSYVGEDGEHKVFDSETDLGYPPDWKRFLSFLESAIRSAIRYLDKVCEVLRSYLGGKDAAQVDPALWAKAGQTGFSFLKK